MTDTKLGGKKHGMVLIISVGKKGDKDPVHTADPDTKKKASMEDLQQESAAMRAAGDKLNARRFADVADAMSRGGAHRQSLIDRFGSQASNAITNQFPEMADNEGYAEMMYEEGRNNPDYQEARSDKSYLGDDRTPFMQAISALERGKKRVGGYEENAQEQLRQLIAEDPTKYFADRRMMATEGEN
jgi:hypothetical protein